MDTTNNLYNTKQSHEITTMDAFVKNLHLYKLLKDESETSEMFKNNIKLKEFLGKLEIDIFMGDDVYSNEAKLNEVKSIMEDAIHSKISAMRQKNANKQINTYTNIKVTNTNKQTTDMQVPKSLLPFFNNLIGRIATGETLWSQFKSLNSTKASQFQSYLYTTYGIKFNPTDDNNAVDILSKINTGGKKSKKKIMRRKHSVKRYRK